MSMYYNTQIVKLLMNERIEEARRAGLVNHARTEERATEAEALRDRTTPVRRTGANTVACSC